MPSLKLAIATGISAATKLKLGLGLGLTGAALSAALGITSFVEGPQNIQPFEERNNRNDLSLSNRPIPVDQLANNFNQGEGGVSYALLSGDGPSLTFLQNIDGSESILMSINPPGIKTLVLPKLSDEMAKQYRYNVAEGYIVKLKGKSLAERSAEVRKGFASKIESAQGSLRSAKRLAERQTANQQLGAVHDEMQFAEREALAVQKTRIDSEQSDAEQSFRSVAPSFKVRRKFQAALNAFHADLVPSDAANLKKRGYDVSPNFSVKAALADSVPLIKADQAWPLQGPNGQPLTGYGTKIAIIDTGVDYTHSDLGGCLGVGCKVAGGYDVINGDNDPMDDHGHGTHVAATAAGNGVFKGVAPDANIYAYKVLSAEGWGTMSGVIEGIERALDPNSDGDLSDRADVMNLSLGGSGDPDDPAAQAVDNAVSAGAVVAVAAGNNGSPRSIGSPGVARKAITVAASDKYGGMAWFSSEGPVVWNDKAIVKPDFAAPGVNICAAEHDSWLTDYRCQDDKHIAISGTSMATPHVAGAAALLRQAHPDWLPEQIKSALKSTTRSLNWPLLKQGTGQLDVAAALEINSGGTSEETITASVLYDNVVDSGKPDVNAACRVYGDIGSWSLYGGHAYRYFTAVDVSGFPVHESTLARASFTIDRVSNSWDDNNAYVLHRITEPWSPDSVTWTNQPAYDPTPIPGRLGQYGVFEFDITNIVSSWLGGGPSAPNYGVIIKKVNEDVTLERNKGMFACADYTGGEETPKLSMVASYDNPPSFSNKPPPVAELEPISTKGVQRIISGRVLADGLTSWSVSMVRLGDSGGPSDGASWSELAHGTTLPTSADLATVSENDLASGEYIVRLLVETSGGRRAIDYGYLKVDLPEFVSPLGDDIYRSSAVIPVTLVRNGLSLTSGVSLAYSQLGDEAWISLPDSSQWNTSGLASGWYLLRATVERASFRDEVYARIYLDSTLRAGWPIRIPFDDYPDDFCPNCHAWAGHLEPVVVDLNNDGEKEILVYMGGTPPKLKVYSSGGVLRWTAEVGIATVFGGNLHIPLVVDTDNDGQLEIYAYNMGNLVWDGNTYKYDTRLYSFNSSGALRAGWPISIPPTFKPTMLAADLDGNGKKEIIVKPTDAEQVISIISGSGQIISQRNLGWATWGATLTSTPAVGNFDDDNQLEIVVGQPAVGAGGTWDDQGNFLGWNNDGILYILNHDLTDVPGWPITTAGIIFSSPAVGDVDADGYEDIVVGLMYASDPYPDARYGGLYVFNRSGQLIQGQWPVGKGDQYWSSPSLADINNDGKIEVGASKFGYPFKTFIHKFDGTLAPGWPQYTVWNDYYSIIFGDANGDGSVDLMTTAGDGTYVNGGVYGWQADGTTLTGFPRPTEIDAQAPAVLSSLTSDGLSHLVASSDWDIDSTNWLSKLRGSLYVWELGTPYNSSASPWPTFHHDLERTGRYAGKQELTVTKSGTGTGTVSSDPVGINCGADCTEQYSNGTTVTLTATPSANSSFTGWSGDCTGAGSCTITMNAVKTVTATFTRRQVVFTVAKSGTGSGTVEMVPSDNGQKFTCSAFPCTNTVPAGTWTLTSTPNAQSDAAGWSGCNSSTTTTCNITVNIVSAWTSTAKFNLKSYGLTVNKSGIGGGSVVLSAIGIGDTTCTTFPCSNTYPSGTVVAMATVPNANSSFTGWSGACTGAGACTITMNAAKTVTATFTRRMVGLTINKLGAGSGSVQLVPDDAGQQYSCTTLPCTVSIPSGAWTLTSIPNSQSTAVGWSSCDTSTLTTCRITLNAARTVTAKFNLKSFVLTLTKSGTGTGTTYFKTASGTTYCYTYPCVKTYTSGTVVTISATPGANSTFIGWSGGGCTGTVPCNITMNAVKTVGATFNLK